MSASCPFCSVVIDGEGVNQESLGICPLCNKYVKPLWYGHSEDFYGKVAPTNYWSESKHEAISIEEEKKLRKPPKLPRAIHTVGLTEQKVMQDIKDYDNG
jgi:hypothetical protein